MTVVDNKKQITIKISMPLEKPAVVFQEKYSNFADVFSKINADILPKYSMHDLAIETEKRKISLFGPVYNYLGVKFQTLRDYVNEMLAKSFIISFKFPFEASVLFTKKKYSDLCLCVDYQGLNAITMKNNYLLLLIQILLNMLIGS